MSRLVVRLSCLAMLLLSTGCALHARAPEPDLGGPGRVRAAAARSEMLVRVRLPYGRLTALVEQVVVAEKRLGQQSAIASWSLVIKKRPGVRVRPQGDRLCFYVPFEGRGAVQMLGRAVARRVAGGVELCARPRLSPDAVLSLREPAIRVVIDGGRVALNTRVLADQLRAFLRDDAARRLIAGLTTIKLSLPELLAPFRRALAAPLRFNEATAATASGGACLRLRAEEIVLGQPRIEATALRFAAAISGRPSLESPCAEAPAGVQRMVRPPTLRATLQIAQRPSHLQVPIGLSTARAQTAIMAELRRNGPIRWPDGLVEIKALRVDTSRGAVVVHASLSGRTRGYFFGIATTRPIDGEVIIWGRPAIVDGRVGLAQAHMSIALDDRLADLAAALRASQLQAIITKHLSLPVAQVTTEARRHIQRLATSLRVGKVPLPARVRIERLTVTGAHAGAQRLVLEVRFVGWIVLEPDALGAHTAPKRHAPRRHARPGR